VLGEPNLSGSGSVFGFALAIFGIGSRSGNICEISGKSDKPTMCGGSGCGIWINLLAWSCCASYFLSCFLCLCTLFFDIVVVGCCPGIGVLSPSNSISGSTCFSIF